MALTYPDNPLEFYHWIFALVVSYLLAALALRFIWPRGKTGHVDDFVKTKLFNALIFAGSAGVLWGVLDPAIFQLLDNANLFLMTSGLAGLIYALQQLFIARD